MITVVGNGCAGVEAIKALRESGYRGEIHLLAEGDWPPYNPMLTTYFVAGKIGFEGLFPYGDNESLAKRYRVIIHPGSPVVALDAERRVVANRAGLEIRYDRCLVSTGASPVLPRIEGIGSSRVYTMRTVEDALRLKQAFALRPRRALVVGASMVGIKLVELFRDAGVEVCLADLAGQLFPLAAHPQCAQAIADRLMERGVRLRLGAAIQRIEDTATGVRAHFSDGGEGEEADLLVMCIGVRPNLGFLDRRQVELRQGVLVDERMRTSAEGLYAAGDVAQGRELLSGEQQVIGLLANARYQGRTAGRNMAGIPERHAGSIPHNITHFMGMDFVGIGDVRDHDRMDVETDGRRLVMLFWREGHLVGANLLDSITESGIIKGVIIQEAMRRGTRDGWRDHGLVWSLQEWASGLPRGTAGLPAVLQREWRRSR